MKIAIAGVGGIGKHILDALLKTPHSICTLSTRTRPDLEDLGIEVYTVDYTVHATLFHALQGVDLCICTLPCFTDPKPCYEAQLSLIKAAEEAGVTKFVPSEWEPLPSKRKTNVLFQEYKNQLIDYLRSQPMQMSWTCFSPGIFLDYYSPSSPRTTGRDKLASSETLWPAVFTFIVDFDKKTAEIPGDGNTGTIAFTAADDVGGFLAAACTQLPLSVWPAGEWGICGGLYTPNDIVNIAEKVRGSNGIKNWLMVGPLQTRYFLKETISRMDEDTDKGDVAEAFHWKVLLAVLKDELLIKHKAHGINYEFQDLEKFIRKWWPSPPTVPS